ncbi:unnamed protein product [Rhizoctonia solani]|uniref:Uncharacterized protein n=1 Tax=Rhizoctonia solani TaxID=456999 RepID=A0A8H3GI12_9AGAM|nr:unnamed protein product [Rhizoctonia solani]
MMSITPANIPIPFILPPTPRTPRPPRRSSTSPSDPYTPTGSAKAARSFQPPLEPQTPITAADRTNDREVYRARGQMDPAYVFPKPPRAQRPCRPSEKQASPKREVKQYYPLCTSPGVTVKFADARPVSDEPEMKQLP